MIIKEFETELQTAQAKWESTLSLLKQSQYDFEKNRPTLNEQSLEVFSRRVRLILESLLSMLPSKESDIETAILGSRIRELRPNLQNFINHLDSSLSQIQQNWRKSTLIRDSNENFSWQLFDKETHYANLDLTSNFSQLNSLADALLGTIGSTLPLIRTKNIGDLSKRAEALGKITQEIDSLRKQAQDSKNATEAYLSDILSSKKSAQDAEAEANAILAAIRALQSQANSDVGAVSSLVEQIKTTGTNAGTLETIILDYKSKFDAFQKQLDSRNEQFQKFLQEHNEKRKHLNLESKK
jgi:chromosome segregation ATPase